MIRGRLKAFEPTRSACVTSVTSISRTCDTALTAALCDDHTSLFVMERLESLGNALSQITLYDIKSVYNQVSRSGVFGVQCSPTVEQAKNVVLNVSEMEAKVRDATNEEPWYTASLLFISA